ncbi:recombinase family protein [Actinosynnema sp. NPDC051121]
MHGDEDWRSPEEPYKSDDEGQASPQTEVRQDNISRWNNSRQDLIAQLRAKQVPDEYAATSLPSAGLAAANEHPSRRARLALSRQERRSSPIAFVYLRVSTKEQARRGGNAEGYSIPAQRAATILKADELGAVVAEEYVDAGDSARSADRDDLQRMLRDIKTVKPDYLIIHKIDRLARNREDDIAINVLLKRHGVQLVSCMENIDDTPSGKLLYGLLAEIAQFYSGNLGQEVMKGLLAKAEEGGTPYRAPLGYLNYRELKHGVERAWVELDSDRYEVVRWCFEQYATGEWTVADLTLAAQDKGLTSRPTATKPAAPIALSTMHHMLQNPYYMGIVPYRGIHYEGSHAPLVEPEVWLAVQDILASRTNGGEKDRKHPHYLRGSIYCSACGGRLVFSQNKGNGGLYEYYFCVKKKTKANNCKRRAVRVARIEDALVDFYSHFRLQPQIVDLLRKAVASELATRAADAERGTRRARKRKAQLEAERHKLLQAHYAGAIPADLLGSEMQRFTRELAEADSELSAARSSEADVLAGLEAAIRVAERITYGYLDAPDQVRRQINQGFFKKLFIGEDGSVERAELQEPFASLNLAVEQAARLTSGREATATGAEAVEETITAEGEGSQLVRRDSPSDVLVVSSEDNTTTESDTKTTHRDFLSVRGLNEAYVVGAAGFEPATARV